MENLKYCYMFLECTPDVDETTLRESFFYKILDAYYQMNCCKYFHEAHYTEKSVNDSDYKYYEEKDKRLEMDLINKSVEVLCDSYLSIILSRIDSEKYKFIIDSLLQRWEYDAYLLQDKDGNLNSYLPLGFPKENEELALNSEYIDKKHYIGVLNEVARPLVYPECDFDSKVAIIANIEQEYMDENKCLKKIRRNNTKKAIDDRKKVKCMMINKKF